MTKRICFNEVGNDWFISAVFADVPDEVLETMVAELNRGLLALRVAVGNFDSVPNLITIADE